MAQYSLFNLDTPYMPVLDVSRCYSKPIEHHETILPILLNSHYLHRNCQTILRVGMWVDNVLAGICCFGTTIASVSDAVCGKEFRYNVVDLNRLYIYDWAGKNSESWLIGQAFHWLKKLHPERLIVISYASLADGHIGTVYQATNFLYTGLSSKGGLQFKIRGKELTARATMAQYSTISKPKLIELFGENNVSWEKTTPKNRYVYFLAPKLKRKELLKKLRWPILPYPHKEKDA